MMHVLLDDDLGRLTVQRLRPWHRLMARCLAPSLDRRLADGARPEANAVLAARAMVLTSLSYRRTIYDRKELPDPRQKGNELKCWVAQKDEPGFPHAGYVDYIDPVINRGTGTRQVRAR